MVFGEELHGLVPGAAQVAHPAGARLEPASAAAYADTGRTALAAGGLVCVRGGWNTLSMDAKGVPNVVVPGAPFAAIRRVGLDTLDAAAVGHGILFI